MSQLRPTISNLEQQINTASTFLSYTDPLVNDTYNTNAELTRAESFITGITTLLKSKRIIQNLQN